MLEVMISVLLIVVGMVAAIALLSSGLRNSIDSRNQTIAGLLAQEGAELVRNIRDTNWATGAGSFDHITTGISCRIDKNYSYPTNVTCNITPANLVLGIDGNNFYTHSGATATKFSRKIIIQDDLANNQKIVTSEVIWGGAWPASVAVCNIASKCTYSEVTLTVWGGN